MILRRYVPADPLRQFVEFLWFYADFDGSHSLEHVLPDGTFELVINLQEQPRKLFRRQGRMQETAYRRGWLSGTHSGYIVIDAVQGASMIGAHFRPGGMASLVGSAAEFCDQVVEFEQVWGNRAFELRERLQATSGPAAKFRVLEQFLSSVLSQRPEDRSRRQRAGFAVHRFCREPHLSSIGDVARQLGMTHKHFIDQFREEVGLTPKLFCRIRRFQEVLTQIQARKPVNWADVACSCGYYDQAHFIHEFKEFAGVNPTAYLCLGEDYQNFVPRPADTR